MSASDGVRFGGGAAGGGVPRGSAREDSTMQGFIAAVDRYFAGRMRDRAAAHLVAAVEAIEQADGCVVVLRVPKGRTSTVDVTAYPPATTVLVDTPPLI